MARNPHIQKPAEPSWDCRIVDFDTYQKEVLEFANQFIRLRPLKSGDNERCAIITRGSKKYGTVFDQDNYLVGLACKGGLEQQANEAGELFFRMNCAYLSALNEGYQPLKKIAVIGAPHVTFGGMSVDDINLTDSLKLLQDTGIPIAPDFQVTAFGHDSSISLSSRAHRYDLIIMTSLGGEMPHMMRDAWNRVKAQLPGVSTWITREVGYLMTESWMWRLQGSGAPIIIHGRGEFHEFHPGAFHLPGYKTMHVIGANDEELEVVVSHGYLKNLPKTLTRASWLGHSMYWQEEQLGGGYAPKGNDLE